LNIKRQILKEDELNEFPVFMRQVYLCKRLSRNDRWSARPGWAARSHCWKSHNEHTEESSATNTTA